MSERNVIGVVGQVVDAMDNVRVQFDPPTEGPNDGTYVALDHSNILSWLKPLVQSLAPSGLLTPPARLRLEPAILHSTSGTSLTRSNKTAGSHPPLAYSAIDFDIHFGAATCLW